MTARAGRDRFKLYRVGRDVYVSGRLGTIVQAQDATGAVVVEYRNGDTERVFIDSGNITPRV